LSGSLAGRSFEITSKSLFIGRDTDNDIQVQDPSVSRKHAKVFQKDSKVFIEDLRSQNGTWIDGAALKSRESYELAEGLMDSLLLFLKRIDGRAILLLNERSRELKEVVSRVRDQAGSGVPPFSRTVVRRVFEQAKALMISDTWEEGTEGVSQSERRPESDRRLDPSFSYSISLLPLNSGMGSTRCRLNQLLAPFAPKARARISEK